MRLASRSPEATRAAAAALAEAVPAEGAVVVLSGPLGAGKTEFVKGLVEGLGGAPDAVQSPTFVIAHESWPGGRLRLVHVDCYRVASPEELEGAGLLDWLEPGALVVVEWGERFPEAWPPDRLEVTLERRGAGERGIAARALGARATELLERWRKRAASLAPEGS